IGVVEGREETYDVYYAWDTDSVFEAIREGAADAPPPIVKGDVPLLERVASPDQADRTAVEEAYVAGDRARKRALIEAAAAAGEDAPVGLLRLAIMGDDLDLAAMARRALANASAEEAVDLIVEA